MPRLARLDAPGILHHVMGRGIEKKEIFFNDMDRSDFIDRMAALCEEGALDVYAWVLMPNHFHLLCKTRKRPLSSCMRKILIRLRRFTTAMGICFVPRPFPAPARRPEPTGVRVGFTGRLPARRAYSSERE
jgi:hypothetical protein